MVIPDATLTWASTDPAVATVDASGLVTGVTVGRTSITAASGEVSASSAGTVQSVEMATLMDLHESTGGADWTNRENWGGEEPVGSWYGVEVNEGGRVTALRLSENGLGGQLPENLGDLAFLTELHVDGNEGLSGPIPISLSALSIQQLQYGGTMPCTVRDEAFQAWLNAIPTRGGEFIACNEERSDLMALYDAMGGESWTNEESWGTDAPLEDWHGITVNSNGRVTEIFLHFNNLRGEIPPEIGHFPELRNLNLGKNLLRGEIPPEIGLLTELRELGLHNLPDLTGSIPAEMGNLANLEELWLYNTGLTGAIPPEIGNLASLRLLILYRSQVNGPIPEELGRLTELQQVWLLDNMIDGPLPASLGGLENLRILVLSNNRLTGPLPAELGQLGSLQRLALDDNMLDGPLPPEFGDLAALRSLDVRNNPDLSGPLPDELTALAALGELQAGGTGLCAPPDPDFRVWLNEVVTKWRVRSCGTESHAEAHLIQATQSPEFPVPLVAGRSALLRVFVMSEQETMETIPPVRATFFMDGAEVHSVDIPAGTSAIPTEVQVGELDLSANAEIPGEVIHPGLEMIVEVDPDGTVDPALGVVKRIPAEGRAAVEVQEVPPLYLTLVPFVSTADDNQGAVAFVASATPDHELLFETRTLLPVGAFEITRHPSVTVSSNDILNMLDHMEQIRTMENGTGHWMGLTPNPADGQGIAYLGSDGPNIGKVSVSNLSAGTIAPRTRTQPEPAPCAVRGSGGRRPDLPLRGRTNGCVGVRFARRRVDGAPGPGGPHELLRPHLGQRLLLHERAAFPTRGYVRGAAGRFADYGGLGRRRRGRDPPSRTSIRRRDDARRADSRRDVPADRSARGRERTVLAELRHAGGPGRRRTFRFHIRASGTGRVGIGVGEPRAHGARRHRRNAGGERAADSDHARPGDGPGTGHPP